MQFFVMFATHFTLARPKEHSRNILDASEETLKNIMPALKKISVAVKNGVNANAFNIHVNNEAVGGQVIFHTHFHIIPRFENDGHKLWRGAPYKEGTEKEIAMKIQEKLK